MNSLRKRGELGNQILMFEYLFLLISIAVGISVGVLIYFGDGFDFRQIEADILNSKMQDCISQNFVLDKITSNFYETCLINMDSVEKNKLLIRICENSSAEKCASGNGILFSVGGNFESCFFSGAKENKAYVQCSSKIMEKEGKTLVILTGSNQQIRRIST
jgi:hypothetical protein